MAARQRRGSIVVRKGQFCGAVGALDDDRIGLRFFVLSFQSDDAATLHVFDDAADGAIRVPVYVC